MRRLSQALVEFALVAPVVILLAVAAWDGGSALREQVVLQQAAREGARAGATAYGGAQSSVIQDAVLASASDLPALASVPGFLSVTSDSQSITVQLKYAHTLLTPVLRQLWGGGSGALMLSASSTFFVPRLTPVPATIVPSTPIPTATPTATVVPTATATPTPAAQPCVRIIAIPPLNNNNGYYVTVQLTVASAISAGWTINEVAGGQIEVDVLAGSPPGSATVASASASSNAVNTVSVAAPIQPPATYTVYFFKRGTGLQNPSSGTVSYTSATCT